jgi:hypothetical protein
LQVDGPRPRRASTDVAKLARSEYPGEGGGLAPDPQVAVETALDAAQRDGRVRARWVTHHGHMIDAEHRTRHGSPSRAGGHADANARQARRMGPAPSSSSSNTDEG